MNQSPPIDVVVQKIQDALAPHPIETQLLALQTVMKLETDPETRVTIEKGSGEKSTALDMERAKAEIERAMTGLGQDARHRVVVKIQKQYRDEVKRVAAEERALSKEIDRKKRLLDAMGDLAKWQISASLERNDCSRLHKLKEAMPDGRVIDGAKGNEVAAVSPAVMGVEHTFVIQHNWAAAFEGAEGLDGDSYRLPYDVCAFEFRLGNRTVILTAAQSGDSQKFTSFIEAGDFWYSPELPVPKLIAWLWTQVRAICIALDADVATETVIRASCKLNEKRARTGKSPLPDYRVVDLARRHRIANPAAASGTGTRKRLHFRRGHWRHFETSKTWVKWCLVGNPDLGFIQKSYSL
jgi:hypothetical protein